MHMSNVINLRDKINPKENFPNYYVTPEYGHI